MNALGKKTWIAPDGYIPELPAGLQQGPTGYLSHECACILNTGERTASLVLTIFFEDKDPVVIEKVSVEGRRSLHLRMDNLERDGQPVIPGGCPYSLVIESTEPIIVQMSRLDTTQSNMAFLSTLCYACD